jgi:hypothetical protein
MGCRSRRRPDRPDLADPTPARAAQPRRGAFHLEHHPMSSSPAGAIKPLPPLSAPPEVIAQARINCATRLRNDGSVAEAAQFECGARDDAWAMRHEVNRLIAEAQRGAAAA